MTVEPTPLGGTPADPRAASPEVTARVVDGALRAIARFGLGKLTVDDVAREAGISRATLYRYFPGRGAVLAAVIRTETERLQQGLDEALADVATLAEALAAVAGFGARAFADHAALQHLLATEPGAVLPHLCFAGADNLLTVAADRIGPHLCRFMGPLQARRTGEWLARIVLSYGLAPPPQPTEGVVLSVVREFVIPAAEGRAGEESSPTGG
jgi:AcrR family transcriptional regulator